MHLSDGRCNSSSTEAGVLTAITRHGPTPPEGGTHYHRQRASPSHYCTLRGSKNPLSYPAASYPCIRGAPQRDVSKYTYAKIIQRSNSLKMLNNPPKQINTLLFLRAIRQQNTECPL
ncbi:hypothetical protein AVEN_143259-1 [Araneus ventricosus]|uniref:Uncharacterized protein n=1 Tax=Araneus ventricosus TaxID=182803 RepID=A0A4Y2AFB7_ARAVE|nr:hypothetical protein AVEN_143259-1 [Araneus ventricosus]